MNSVNAPVSTTPISCVVRWSPLLTIDPKWEMSWRTALLSLNSTTAPVRAYLDGVDSGSQVNFIAYEARWHKSVKRDRVIQNMINRNPPSNYARIILIACDQTWPRVREEQVANLASQSMGHLGSGLHACRAYTPESLQESTRKYVRQSLLSLGIIPAEEALSPDPYQQVTEPLQLEDRKSVV